MNVAQQEYLAAMGIDFYLPRTTLAFAAPSPEYFFDEDASITSEHEITEDRLIEPVIQTVKVDHLLQDVLTQVEKTAQPKSNPAKTPQPIQNPQSSIQPFSLSLWRPAKGFLIIAPHNTQALPTELLLQNIVRYHLNQYQLKMDEEIVRWPANGNAKLHLTEQDARDELQTWLSVQHEFQPINQLWFFGDAWHYFVKQDETDINSLSEVFDQINFTVKSFPDLAVILQDPQLKADILSRL